MKELLEYLFMVYGRAIRLRAREMNPTEMKIFRINVMQSASHTPKSGPRVGFTPESGPQEKLVE